MVREDAACGAAGCDFPDPPPDTSQDPVPLVQLRRFRVGYAAGVQEVQRVVLCHVHWAGGQRTAVLTGDPAICAAVGHVL